MSKITINKTKQNEDEDEKTSSKVESKYVKPIFVSGQNSNTLILPKKLAKEYDLESGSHVVIEGTKYGIFIRKIHLEEL